MSQLVISIREIIAIALTMAKRTDFVDRPSTGVGEERKKNKKEERKKNLQEQAYLRSQFF